MGKQVVFRVRGVFEIWVKQGGDLAPVCLCRASANNSPKATGPVAEGMARRLVWREPGGQGRKTDVRLGSLQGMGRTWLMGKPWEGSEQGME